MRRAALQTGLRAGFTTVEVMVALGLFSLAAMAIYSLQVVTISGLSEARELTDATFLAERALEQFRRESSNWSEGTLPAFAPASDGEWGPLYGGVPVTKDSLNAQQVLNRPGLAPPHFCVKARMTTLPALGADAARIEVRVMWPRQDGSAAVFANCPDTMDATASLTQARQISLASTVFRHGVR